MFRVGRIGKGWAARLCGVCVRPPPWCAEPAADEDAEPTWGARRRGRGSLSPRLMRMKNIIEKPAAAGLRAPARGFSRRAGRVARQVCPRLPPPGRRGGTAGVPAARSRRAGRVARQVCPPHGPPGGVARQVCPRLGVCYTTRCGTVMRRLSTLVGSAGVEARPTATCAALIDKGTYQRCVFS